MNPIQLKLEKITRPYSAQAKTVRNLFGLPTHVTRRLADNGRIRFVKLGESKQAVRLYFVDDIIEYLEGEAE